MGSGCIDTNVKYDGVDYWVSYEWSTTNSGKVEVDLMKPSSALDVSVTDADPIKDEEPMKKELKQETVTYGNDLYSRTFLDEGYVSEKEMIKIIESSESFNEDTLELEVLEHCNPGAEIIVADENCFIIGDKIRKLRMM
jgi:hypothetical protein